jgi:hypothetical protein
MPHTVNREEIDAVRAMVDAALAAARAAAERGAADG